MSAVQQLKFVPLRPLAREEAIDHPSGYLALSSQNQRFMLDSTPGFIAYRVQGKHFIALGGVHAPLSSRAILLDGFLAEADRQGCGVVVVQVGQSQLELFHSRGFTVNQFGTTYGLDLRHFSLAGTKRVKLRHKIKQAQTADLQVLEVGRSFPANATTFAQLHQISNAWLRAKGKKELDFMIGELGTPQETERRIFVVTDAHYHFQGFITYVPVWGEHPGYLHDLTRRLPDAPTGTMELCNAHAIERFVAEGVRYLHFGFTPFITDGVKEPHGSRLVTTLVHLLGTYGSAVYPAQRQVQYKLKWGPDFVEREFLACRPLSLRAIIDLLILTRSV
ncbi:MAG: DUF2156 domain-containing protein [Deltaproteobacteria bacterium]|nr:DUF2156 domain-containing protein [Deltaproteobacteria bacterium]